MSSIDPSTFFEDSQEGRLIELTQGYWAIIDEEDYERISQFSWHVSKARRLIYARRSIYDKVTKKVFSVAMHNEIMKGSPDHINVNGLDNRKRNLRRCTQSQNCGNKRKTDSSTSSRFKGVCRVDLPSGTTRWMAYITKDKLKTIGNFDTEEDAALAYDREARRLFGEFARTNFDIDDGRPLVKRSREKLNDDQIDQIKGMIARGLKYKEICEIFGIESRTVYRINAGIVRLRKDM